MGKLAFVLVLVLGAVSLVPLVGTAQEGPRDPLIHGLASFLVPGLGQYLNGEPDKALVHFLVAVAIPTAGYYLAVLRRLKKTGSCGRHNSGGREPALFLQLHPQFLKHRAQRGEDGGHLRSGEEEAHGPLTFRK